ncbi:Csu type fimbrial protein [Cupriavidus sp. H39]|uniref:Csu type fimbrial protein n=1 Tax=Cupriavidus sp. H39 TaxID=3401635 RepID=UPI003D091233
MKASFKLAAAMAIVSASVGAHAAGQISGTVDAQLVLTSSCVVNNGSGPVTSGNFGRLDFGTQPATFTGVLTAQAGGGSPAQNSTITCDTGVSSVNVTVDGGQHAGQGATVGVGSRALTNGNNVFVPYEVFSDSARTNVYTAGTPVTVAVNQGTATPLPIYGRINKTSPAALTAGTYTDTLAVTVAW